MDFKTLCHKNISQRKESICTESSKNNDANTHIQYKYLKDIKKKRFIVL